MRPKRFSSSICFLKDFVLNAFSVFGPKFHEHQHLSCFLIIGEVPLQASQIPKREIFSAWRVTFSPLLFYCSFV